MFHMCVTKQNTVDTQENADSHYLIQIRQTIINHSKIQGL